MLALTAAEPAVKFIHAHISALQAAIQLCYAIAGSIGLQQIFIHPQILALQFMLPKCQPTPANSTDITAISLVRCTCLQQVKMMFHVSIIDQ